MTDSQSGAPFPEDAHLPDMSALTPDALAPRSRAALDALVESGWNLEGVEESLREEAQRILGLFSELGSGPDSIARNTGTSAGAGAVASRTFDAIFGSAALSGEDAAAMDAWVEGGYSLDRVPIELATRAAKHASLAQLVTRTSGAASARSTEGELAARTARLIDLVSTEDADLAPIPISRGSWLRQRVWDVVTAAAMLLVAGSIMWPVLAGMHQRNLELQCGSNLQSVASALSAYAGENRDSLPVAVASFGPQRWWDVNETRPVANSSNLFTLVRNGYTKLGSLACPGNPRAPRALQDPQASDWRSLDEISYSYQLMCGKPQGKWSADERRLVLADRSPAVLRAVRGESPDPRENSPNHRGAGQHGLFTDGSTEWLPSPLIRSGGDIDCIWLPQPPRMYIEGKLEHQNGEFVLTLTGHELPAGGSDVFLGP